MIKDAIGILDNGVEGFSVLGVLTKVFKHENFIYFNDLINFPYFNMPEDDALEIIKENVEKLKKANLKLLVVTSDIIVDLGREFLDELDFPVYDVVSLLIEHINENYEQKNIALFGKSQILEANLYQRNFKYNRLYNIPSEELEDLIENKGLKTSQSFKKTKEVFKPLLAKGADVIVASSPYSIKLETEIAEFVKFTEITNLGEILSNKIYNEFTNLNQKGRGKLYVYSNIEKHKFKKLTSWANMKYKYYDLDKKNRKLRQEKFKRISN